MKGANVRLISSGDVLALTGLSNDQLREWTGRRALICPDIKAHGKGTQARFSWQTVLVLQLADVLKTRFHVELQASRQLFSALQRALSGESIQSMDGKALVVDGTGRWQFRELEQLALGDWSEGGALTLPLRPYLRNLATTFDLPREGQRVPLPLIAARMAKANAARTKRTA
jgi:hypothetical protein